VQPSVNPKSANEDQRDDDESEFIAYSHAGMTPNAETERQPPTVTIERTRSAQTVARRNGKAARLFAPVVLLGGVMILSAARSLVPLGPIC
jgi:hypothetical protein